MGIFKSESHGIIWVFAHIVWPQPQMSSCALWGPSKNALFIITKKLNVMDISQFF